MHEAPVAQLQELRRFAEDVVKKRLDPVLGVAAVLVSGGFEDEIAVNVDQERLAQLNMNVQLLGQRLQAANVNLSGGRLTDRGQEFLVRTMNEFESVGDIADTIVFQQEGSVLRLKDVAEVYESHKERDSIMRVGGLEAIEIAMYKEGDANTVAVAAAIDERMGEMAEELPENYELVKIYDQAEFISAAIDEVRSAAIIGAIFAVIVLYLFPEGCAQHAHRHGDHSDIGTGHVRADGCVFDITLNIMSLGGIALAVGMLMDNAIVVLENIARHRDGWAQRPASNGCGCSSAGNFRSRRCGTGIHADHHRGVSAIGVRRRHRRTAFQRPGADRDVRVGGIAHLGVYVDSHAGGYRTAHRRVECSPGCRAARLATDRERAVPQRRAWLGVDLAMELRGWLRSFCGPWNGSSTAAMSASSVATTCCCARRCEFRTLTMVVALAALAGAVAVVPSLPVELIPPLSQGEFRVDVELEPGTRLELTDQVLAAFQQELLAYPIVDSTYSVAGTGGKLDASASRGGEQVGELSVVLIDGTTPDDESLIMSLARQALAVVPAAQFKVDRPQLFTFATPLEVEVAGNDLAAIEDVANRLVAAMADSPSFSDVESSIRPGYPELQIEFDQETHRRCGPVRAGCRQPGGAQDPRRCAHQIHLARQARRYPGALGRGRTQLQGGCGELARGRW